MASLEQLEQDAEERLVKALGKYSGLALTVGLVAALLMLGWAVLLLSAGSLIGCLAAVAIGAVILWLVALLRVARTAVKAPV